MVERSMLKEVFLFSELSEEQLEQVARLCREKRFAEGAWCFKQGDPAEHLYILQEGRVALVFELPPREADRAITIETVEPLQIFGWSAIVPPHETTLSARSVQPSVAYRLSGEDLRALFERDKEIGCAVMAKVAELIKERLRAVQQQLVMELSSVVLAGHY